MKSLGLMARALPRTPQFGMRYSRAGEEVQVLLTSKKKKTLSLVIFMAVKPCLHSQPGNIRLG